MGSDFTYADLDGVEIEDYTFKIVKDSDVVDGADCWIIEATPKSKDVIKETGYLKTLTWIRKDIFFGVKGRILLKKGKKVKLWSAKDLKKIDGVWIAKTQQMTTTKKKKREHSSIFIIDTIAFNKKLDDSLFELRLCSEAINKRAKALVYSFLFYYLTQPVFAQSDDDFLSDFGGDDFEELESELDLVTTNVIENFANNSIEKKPTSESFDWNAVFLKSYIMA